MAGLAAGNPLHEQPKILFIIARIDYQVEMVGHQAEGIYLAAKFNFSFPEIVKVIEGSLHRQRKQPLCCGRVE